MSRVLQYASHLLGYRHEEIVENLQHDRIDVGTNRHARGSRHCAGEEKMSTCRHSCLPARINHCGRRGLYDDCGARHSMARQQYFAGENRDLVPGTVAKHTAMTVWLRLSL